jgi:hypothetical protein
MFGNQPDLMSPVPVIDVSPNTPAMTAEAQMIPSGVLAQSKAEISAAEKQATAQNAGAQQMINAPTTVNNDNTQVIQSSSSVHAGGVPAGTGRGR